MLGVPLQSWSQPAMVLGRQNSTFTVDGVPTFLVFISYFGALRPTGVDPDPNSTASNSITNLWAPHKTSLATEFAHLHAKGVNGIRIFPNWWWSLGSGCTATVADQHAVIRRDGSINLAAGLRMLEVIELARRHQLVVDVSWTIEGAAPVVATALSKSAYASALHTITTFMAGGYRNALFDLENEYNNGPICPGYPTVKPSFSRADLVSAVRHIKSADPARIMTASPTVFTGNSCGIGVQQTIDDVASYVDDAHAAGMDVFAVHDQRCYSPTWYGQTQAFVQKVREITSLPVYLQEPDRWVSDSPLTSSDFLTAVQGAVNGGAAAWTFHTEATFKLNAQGWQPLLNQPVEFDFLDQKLPLLNRSSWP
ncbi:MAG TPA: hypothetical protein VMW48_19795 [Vicinamibacterales bacterium]|nr:hypothetical protein [Vicinamibacterales bacterium]